MKESNSKYDIAIAYRIYPGVSKIPPVFRENKLKLTEFGLLSLKRALDNISYKIIFLLDNCPTDYQELIKEIFDKNSIEIISLSKTGNAGTFGKQIDILLNQEYSDFVYFAEDDYFYLPNAVSKMLDTIKNDGVDFVTPYDHPDYYTLEFHNYNRESIVLNDVNWQSCATTCMTFLTTKEVLKKTESIFRTYQRNNFDASLWKSLTKYNLFNIGNTIKTLKQSKSFVRVYIKMWQFGFIQHFFGKKYKLYAPVPSISTHLDSTLLAPGIDWEKEFQVIIDIMKK